MGKSDYLFKEQECLDTFSRLGTVFNACTPENHPIIFATDDDFRAAMSILAISVKLYPQIYVFAFQLMSNHMHLVISGEETTIYAFFKYFRNRLEKYFDGCVDLSGFELKLFAIKDLAYLRNTIVYTNRNGFVVRNDVTPFSYPWGSSAFFFQPIAVKYAKTCGSPLGIRQLRALMHSHDADEFKDLKVIEGYVSPLEFCDIATAERVFRDAKHYFYMVSRNVEAYREVARSIGESVFCNDTDLYLAALSIAKEQFGVKDLNTLTTNDRLALARRLHFDYNAGDKQLQRLLKLDPDVLKALF